MAVAEAKQGREVPRVSIVFPTYNAIEFIDRTWDAVRAFRSARSEDWEVLFVCDGCSDGTDEQLEKLTQCEDGLVRVLAYAGNRGKGYAVRYGLAHARGQFRIFTDVDLAYRFEDVLRVVETLEQGNDVAIASRVHPESRIVLPPRLQGYAYRRHLQSQLFSALVRFILPLTQRDTQAGLKGMTAAAAQLLAPNLRCDGFGFDCELLTACVRLGLNVAEVPVCVRYEDSVSTTGLRSINGMVRELFNIRRNWQRLPETMPVRQADKRQAA